MHLLVAARPVEAFNEAKFDGIARCAPFRPMSPKGQEPSSGEVHLFALDSNQITDITQRSETGHAGKSAWARALGDSFREVCGYGDDLSVNSVTVYDFVAPSRVIPGTSH